jgi:hypothetical protein
MDRRQSTHLVRCGESTVDNLCLRSLNPLDLRIGGQTLAQLYTSIPEEESRKRRVN